MLRVADADAAAVVNRNPRCARGGIHERVQERPIRDRVAPVEHALGLAIRRRNRAGVEVIAPDHDRRLHFAAFHQLVDGEAKFRAFTIAEPANPAGQSLELNALLRQFHPAREDGVVGKHLERETIGPRDIGRVATQCGPAKWPFPFAKERPDVLRNEAWNIERVLHSGLFRLRTNVVAVVECDRAFLLQREHRLDMHRHRFHRTRDVFLRICCAQLQRLRQRHLVRYVTVESIVRAGLIGQDIGHDLAPQHLREHIGAVADQPDRERFAIPARALHHLHRLIEAARDIIAIAALEPLLDPRRINVDSEKNRARHRRRERLRTAHSAHPAGDDKLSFE